MCLMYDGRIGGGTTGVLWGYEQDWTLIADFLPNATLKTHKTMETMS